MGTLAMSVVLGDIFSGLCSVVLRLRDHLVPNCKLVHHGAAHIVTSGQWC